MKHKDTFGQSPRPGTSPPTQGSRGVSPTPAIVLVGLFAALAHVSSFHPIKLNVEFKTLILVCSGMVGGSRLGALTGLTVGMLQGLLDPFGAAGWIMTIHLASAYVLIGAFGFRVLAALEMRAAFSGQWEPIPATLTGVLAALVFDMITTVPMVTVFGTPISAVLAQQLPFTVIHVVSNGVVFAVGIPALSRIPTSMIASLRPPMADGGDRTPTDELHGPLA